MADLICASSLTGVPGLIEAHGGDVDALLGRVGIDPAVVGAYDRFVPFTALAALIGLCARELATPDFGLRLAGRQDPDILGPIAIAARNAQTVGDALAQVTTYAHVYSPAITAQLHVDGVEVTYEFGTLLKRLPYRPHVVELALGVTLSTFRMLGGEEFRPIRITFTHPRISPPAAYAEHLGCPIEFEAERDSLTFHAGLLRRRLRQVDPLAHDVAIRLMTGQDRDDAFEGVVSALVVRSLPTGAATLEDVSRLLMMHPRAVQRGLADAGTTFATVVDDVRRDLASDLLASRAVPLSTVARQLGYTEQSSLTRSCRRWYGMAPLAKRRELTAARLR